MTEGGKTEACEAQPTRIVVLHVGMYPSVELTIPLYEYLKNQFGAEYRFVDADQATVEDVEWCDVLVSIRGFSKIEQYFVRLAKDMGRFVILHIDDHLLLWDPPTIPFILKARKNALRDIAAHVDVTLANNKKLGQIYGSIGDSRIVLVNTSVDLSLLVHEDRGDDKVKLFYPGPKDHAALFDSFVSPILPRLFERYGKRLSLTIIGPEINFHPDPNNPEIDYTQYSFMPLKDYNNFVREQRFDIGLAPLLDTEFCSCKYFNKYFDFAEKGMVGIYSNVEPYTFAVTHGYNGWLADPDPESWYDILCSVIDDVELRRTCFANIQKDIAEHYTEDIVLSGLMADIPEFASYKAQHPAPQTSATKADKRALKMLRMTEKPARTLWHLIKKRSK